MSRRETRLLALIWGLCVPVYGLSTCAGRGAEQGCRQVREISTALDGNQRRARAAQLAPSMQDNNTVGAAALDFTKLLQIIAACATLPPHQFEFHK